MTIFPTKSVTWILAKTVAYQPSYTLQGKTWSKTDSTRRPITWPSRPNESTHHLCLAKFCEATEIGQQSIVWLDILIWMSFCLVSDFDLASPFSRVDSCWVSGLGHNFPWRNYWFRRGLFGTILNLILDSHEWFWLSISHALHIP